MAEHVNNVVLHGMGLHGQGGKTNLLTEAFSARAQDQGERLWIPELAEHHDQPDRNITVVRHMAALVDRVHAYLHGADSPVRVIGHSHGAGKVFAATLLEHPEDAERIESATLINPLLGPINPNFEKFLENRKTNPDEQTDLEKEIATLVEAEADSQTHIIHTGISGSAEALIIPESQFAELKIPSPRSEAAAAAMFRLLDTRLSLVMGTKDKWLGPIDKQKERIVRLGGATVNILELETDHNGKGVEALLAEISLRGTVRT